MKPRHTIKKHKRFQAHTPKHPPTPNPHARFSSKPPEPKRHPAASVKEEGPWTAELAESRPLSQGKPADEEEPSPADLDEGEASSGKSAGDGSSSSAGLLW